MKCKCGRDVGRVEVRVVQRCERGHYVSSDVAPAILTTAGEPEMASSGQVRAFHAKCTVIDRMHDQRIGTAKAQMLQKADLTSTSEFNATDMTELLDRLEEVIARGI